MRGRHYVLAALALAAVCAGLVCSAASERARALHIWRQSTTVGQRVPMIGEMTLVVRHGPIAHEVRARYARAADGRYRLDYTDPPPARGRVVWFDGKDSWQLEPRRGILIRTSVSGQAASLTAADRALVERNYRIALAPGHAAAAGRAAYLLELRAVQAGKGWQRRWIDKATFRTLRVDSYYADGTLARSLSYDHVTLPARVPETALKPSAPPGTRVVHTVEPAQPIAAAQMRSLAESLDLRADGPRGFRLDRAMAGRIDGHSVMQLLYSDGLETVSVFVQDCPAAPTSAPPDWRAVSRGGLSAYERQGEHAVTLIWVREGRRYTAVSQIADGALLDFAAGLGRQ